jgi:hypothetical protein
MVVAIAPKVASTSSVADAATVSVREAALPRAATRRRIVEGVG